MRSIVKMCQLLQSNTQACRQRSVLNAVTSALSGVRSVFSCMYCDVRYTCSDAI